VLQGHKTGPVPDQFTHSSSNQLRGLELAPQLIMVNILMW